MSGGVNNSITGLSDLQVQVGRQGIITGGGSADSTPLSTAYFAAASISDPTEQAAVEQFELDIKGQGSTTNNSNISSKLQAVYLISPTSLAASTYNFMNPAAFNLTHYNSPTHATTGVTYNGSTQYSDTGYNVDTNATINDHSYGVLMSGTWANFDCPFGIRDSGNPYNLAVWSSLSDGVLFWGVNGAADSIAQAAPNGNLISVSRTGNTSSAVYRDGASIDTSANAVSSKPNYSYFIGALNDKGTAHFYFAGQIQFAFIGSGLTANESDDLYDAVTTYNANVIGGGR